MGATIGDTTGDTIGATTLQQGSKQHPPWGYLGVLKGSADALPIAQQLTHSGQEDSPQRHELLFLLLAQVQCVLKKKYSE